MNRTWRQPWGSTPYVVHLTVPEAPIPTSVAVSCHIDLSRAGPTSSCHFPFQPQTHWRLGHVFVCFLFSLSLSLSPATVTSCNFSYITYISLSLSLLPCSGPCNVHRLLLFPNRWRFIVFFFSFSKSIISYLLIAPHPPPRLVRLVVAHPPPPIQQTFTSSV